jgi:hypothetical protein
MKLKTDLSSPGKRAEKSEAIACARSCRSSRLMGSGHEKNNRKKWRAKEEQRQKRRVFLKLV